MPPRVLITGGGGQLSSALSARLGAGGPGDRAWAPTEFQLDITDRAAVRRAVAAHRPDWVVNCAAYTAVDAAEADREKAFLINAEAVRILADEAHAAGARLIHISTDYVFDGTKGAPYVEDDPTNPVNAYGASKLAGEEVLRDHPVRWAVFRTAWLYSEGGRNFVLWALENGRKCRDAGQAIRVVDDQEGSPTDAHTLAGQLETAMEADLRGLFHSVGGGSATWYEFAGEIFAQAGIDVRREKIRAEELRRPARRADRVVLANRRLEALGLCRMLPWQEGLRGVMARLRG